MPNRILREGINSSARINKLSSGGEVLYRRLMSVVDDYGRFHANPVTVRGACWPTFPDKVTEHQVSDWMKELTAGPRPLILLYDVDGAKYMQIQGFGQQVRSKSKFPEVPEITLPADCEQSDINLPADCEQLRSTSRSRSRISEAEAKPLSPTVVGGPAENLSVMPNDARSAVEQIKARPQKVWFDDQHDSWYGAFWCHKGKAASRKAYERAVCRMVDREGLGYNQTRLFLGEKAQEDRSRFEGTQDWEWRVNLHPATWLNQERWTDEPGPEVHKLTVHQERNRQTLSAMKLLEQMRNSG